MSIVCAATIPKVLHAIDLIEVENQWNELGEDARFQ